MADDRALRDNAKQGNLDRVRELVEAGSDVNSTSGVGYTALHWAARNDHVDVVRYLLAAGADRSLTTSYGKTPVDVAPSDSEAREVLVSPDTPTMESLGHAALGDPAALGLGTAPVPVPPLSTGGGSGSGGDSDGEDDRGTVEEIVSIVSPRRRLVRQESGDTQAVERVLSRTDSRGSLSGDGRRESTGSGGGDRGSGSGSAVGEQGERVSSAAAGGMGGDGGEVADVLLVPLNGVYRDGAFYCEHDDRDVFCEHLTTIGERVRALNYTHVVLCGGHTKRQASDLSEAASVQSLWDDTDSQPIGPSRVILDTVSLDSAENVLFGLMAARQRLGSDVRLRRVGVWCAWKFKKARFVGLANTLGISDRFYFHGCQDASATCDPGATNRGERELTAQLRKTGDWLLLGSDWHGKREERYVGSDGFAGRVRQVFGGEFPSVVALLESLQGSAASDEINEAGVTALRDAFAAEVMRR